MVYIVHLTHTHIHTYVDLSCATLSPHCCSNLNRPFSALSIPRMSESLDTPALRPQDAKVHDPRQSETERMAKSDRWSRHIAQIRRLYIDQNLSLEEVMETMARNFDFHAGYDKRKAKTKSPPNRPPPKAQISQCAWSSP